jgi:hypothetical protein
MTIDIPDPELQVTFASALASIRESMLQEALGQTVRELDIPTVDRELAAIVPSHSLTVLAGHGLRGELMFPVPSILTANPRLLGYYRLLYGYSQKQFYNPAVAGRFKALETTGSLSQQNAAMLDELCTAMAKAGALLLAGISAGSMNAGILDDLTLLTLGPQLRGGANVSIGTAGIVAVFGVIKEIVATSVKQSEQSRIELKNAAGRMVLIEFAADPDIVIREEMRPQSYRKLIAIEVKGGRDVSNIHNRIGEAEKSHQKARLAGFVECWTVVNVPRIDLALAKQESPSTNRFYLLSDLVGADGAAFEDFRDRIVSLTGIAG